MAVSRVAPRWGAQFRKVLKEDPFDFRRERSPQTVSSKVSTGASTSLYQARPHTVAFSLKGDGVVVDQTEEVLRD